MKTATSKAAWYTTLVAGTAAGPAALGSIVYTNVEPDLTGPTVAWDLDNGGVPDFRLQIEPSNGQEKSNLDQIDGSQAAGIAINANNNAAKLLLDDPIGSSTPFSNATDTKTLLDESSATPQNYDWSKGDRGYLGLRLNLGGNIHNGWADVSINPIAGDSFTHTLYGYAYEDTPDAEILAGAVPEPSMATLLVAGAAGVGSLRRRRA